MTETQSRSRASSRRNLISTLMFIVAAMLLVYAAYSWYEGRNDNDAPPPPPSVPGHAELKNVHDALVAQGLDVEYGKDGARIEDVSSAGQQLTVDGFDLYVFIFETPEQREQELAGRSDGDLELLDLFGEPLTDADTQVYQQSNVLAVLVGGDEEVASDVEAGISSIP